MTILVHDEIISSMASTSLKDKVALITGASSGIGKAIALSLAKEGVSCSLAARREEALKDTSKEIEKLGSKALIVPTDVTQEKDLKNLVKKTVFDLGRIDFLINNAGIYFRSTVEELEKDQLDKLLATNLVAPMILTKLALPHLKKTPGSAVINLASVAGKTGFGGLSAYCASKFGLRGFSEALFDEVREFGVKVCVLCPGFIKTPMVTGSKGLDDEKMIPVEEVAQTVLNVLQLSDKTCPTEIVMRPQYSPYL